MTQLTVSKHWRKTKAKFENKNRFVCTLWLSVHMKSAVKQGFFHEFAFHNKALKTFVEFWICWKRSKFECCWIQFANTVISPVKLCHTPSLPRTSDVAWHHENLGTRHLTTCFGKSWPHLEFVMPNSASAWNNVSCLELGLELCALPWSPPSIMCLQLHLLALLTK